MTLSREAADMLGVAEDAVTTRADLRRMLPPEDAARTAAAMDRTLRDGVGYDMEFRIVRADGQERWIASRGSLSRGADGGPVTLVGVLQDLTDRKRVEDALREESRVLEILNRSGAAIASELDLKSLLQTVTDAATELSGARFGAFFYNRVSPEGESYQLVTLTGARADQFGAVGLPRNTPVFAPTFRGERVVRSADITRDARYGTVEPHRGMPAGHLPVRSYLAIPVISRSKEVIGGLFFGHPDADVFTDRAERLVLGIAAQAAIAIDNARLYEAAQVASSERERLLVSEQAARARAERLSAMKDQFLATLSHELRTPLGAILGWSQVMRSRKMSEAELHRALEVVERNARAQARLIDDLLDTARITEGQVRLDVQVIDLAAFVEAALETVRPGADAKGIRIVTAVDPGAGTIHADPSRLHQVAWNLLSNAIKFTPKDGEVRVTLEHKGSSIELSVADTGVGIPADFLPHVFDRFAQADGSPTRRHEGLGLGLAIAQQLVQLHGGSLRAESAGEGLGATFRVQLPVAPAPPGPGGR